MPCYGLDLDPAFAFARAHGVEAERVEAQGSSWVFLTHDREVYRIPQKYVRAMAELPDRAAAIAWLKARHRQPIARGVQGPEAVAARRGGERSPVIEGVRARLEERGPVRR